MWKVEIRDARGVIHDRATLESGRLTIGRSRNSDLSIFDPVISLQHAWLIVRDGQLWITDVDSTNGVVVDGERISGSCQISAESRIQLASFTLELSTVATEEADSTASPDGQAQDTTAAAENDAVLESIPGSPPGTAADLLQQKIHSIRSHRSKAQSAAETRRQEFEAEWQQVLDELRALRQRISELDSVLYFAISRDCQSVSMKIQRQRTPKSMLMTRGHPDRPVGGEERIFVRDHELPDRSFARPRDALNEFLSHIASLLA